MWWTYTPSVTTRVTVMTDGSSYDTVLAVYTGASVGSLTAVVGNDDGPGIGSASVVTWDAQASVTYHIAVDGFGSTSAGNVVLNAWFSPRPANDDFADALPLATGASASATDITMATKQAGEPSHAGAPGGHSIWWTLSVPEPTWVELTTAGSGFDTVLGIYSGSGVGSLSPVVSNDDDPVITPESRVQFTALPGTTYRIAADGWTGVGTVLSNTVPATRETNEPTHFGSVGASSVWWRYSPPGRMAVTISTEGSGFDTVLAAYTGSSLDSLVAIVGNDDAADIAPQSRIQFIAQPGTTYRIASAGFGAASAGPLSLTTTLVPTGSAPSKPVSLVATPGDHAIGLSWAPPAALNGWAVTSYEITTVPDLGLGTIATLGTSYELRGIDPSVPLTISVRARNLIGLGAAAKVASQATAASASFSDVPPTHPFVTPIAWMVDQGITSGYADGTFRGGSSITRQAMASFLWRSAGSPAGPFADPGFSDVGPSNPFHTAISWLVANEITTGYADSTFRPAIYVTRQAVGAFLYRMWVSHIPS